MKTKKINLIIPALAAVIGLFSCKKDAATVGQTDSNLIFDQNSINDSKSAGSYYDRVTGYTTFVMQPGDDNGQDAWIDWKIDDPIYANGNSGPIDQFKVLGWTIGGSLVKTRTMIRFDDLGQIPSTAKVLGAKLFFYGLPSSPIHLPQGNSSYSGSPYNSFGDNSTYVQKITTSWDESTVTWNTQPTTSVLNQSLISPSTSQWNYNASCDITKIVQSQVSNPSQNYGVMLKLVTEDIYRSMGFCSSEYADASKHPKLVVVYK